MEIQDKKEVWVVWTNTDCTEGRGYNIPKAVCNIEATARRVGIKGYVQGTNCPVSVETAIKINGKWLAPVFIREATKEDIDIQEKLDAKARVFEKAKSAGLTDEDMKLLAEK